MAFYIKKPQILNSSKDVFYKGNQHWSDDLSQKKDYADAANAEMVNPNGKNGGWTGAQVLSE